MFTILHRSCRFLFLAVLLTTTTAAQQGPPVAVEVSANRLVAADPDNRPLVEPHLAIDPENRQHWLAGVIAASPDLKSTDCAALVSFDGGQTWARHHLGLKQCYDPWTGILPDGTGLLTVIGNESSDLMVYRSDDGGRTWRNPVSLGDSQDHDTFVIGRTGKYTGNVLVASQQGTTEKASGETRDAVFVARSIDGGRTFQEPVRVFPSNLHITTMNPAFLSDGTLLIPYSDFARDAVDGKGTIWLDRQRDWLLRSKDGGHTFLAPALMSESCAKTFAMLAVDGSGSLFRDRVYWLCNDGAHENIYLHYSPDGGEHWSKPVRVNQDSGTTPHVRNAVMAVNAYGVIGVTWYDARGDQRGNMEFLRCQELYFAASLDGGQTFLPEERVGAKSCPLSPKNGEAGIRYVTGGDYDGVITAPDGRFHLLWSDSRDGIYKLWAASVTVNGRPASGKP